MNDSPSILWLSPDRYRAAVFDLDGVVTRTAKVHAAAWKAMFDEFLQARGQPPFDAEDEYRRHVDGKPRYEGVADLLEARGIDLPRGSPDDPPGTATVCGLGNRKNRLFLEKLEQQGVEVFDSSLALIRDLRAQGIAVAVVSSSRNCAAVLEAAGLSDLFAARVDGVEAERLGLAGKPAPDLFLEAVRRLGYRAEESLVLEDALAGVEAGARGGFGCVVGIDRDARREAFLEHGADAVVADASAIRLTGGEAQGSRVPAILEHIAAGGRPPALFLDYDGTLTPIVERPEDAELSPQMRAALRRLAGRCPLAVVSGRDLDDVRERVGLDDIWYAGSHGFDLTGPGGRREAYPGGEALRPALAGAEDLLRRRLAGIDGCRVEHKRYGVAVHYRQVAAGDVPRVRETVEAVAAAYPGLRRTGGKKVLELRPDVDWDKGRALGWLIDALGLSPEVPLVYIGDDETDEDAFRALGPDGTGILVAERPRETAARYRLPDPEAVRALLETLAERLETGP